MAKLIVKWDECYVNGPEFSKPYKFEESTGSFVTEEGKVEDDSITVINEFVEKYKSLHKDVHKIFDMSENYGCVMIEFSGAELLLPEESNNVFAQLFSSNIDNNRGPGFGSGTFPDEFFQDLFNIFKDENDEVDSGINGSLCGNFDGYYTFDAELKPNGILWDTCFYDEEDF